MPSGRIAIWKESISGSTESRLGTFDFSLVLQPGDTILASPAPVFEYALPADAPVDAGAITAGTPAINSAGNQVQFRLTLPTGSPTGVLYSVSCTVQTTKGDTWVGSGGLDFAGST